VVGQNWARNHSFGAASLAEPRSVAEIRDLVTSNRRVGVVGAAHSFNDIADTDGVLLSLRRLRGAVTVDRAASTVTAPGGIRYHELATRLHAQGYALHNLPSVPHFSVVGACSTATHGSGDANGGLATAVRGLEMVDGRGEILTVASGGPAAARAASGSTVPLDAAAVALGALGIVTSVTLAVEPTYDVAQEVLLDLPVTRAVDHFDEIMASAYSVSMFTDWQGDTVDQLWRKHRVDAGTAPSAPREYQGARPAAAPVAPSGPANVPLMTAQLLAPGPWHRRLPHVDDRREVQPGVELQTEYFVRREVAPAALEAIVSMGGVLAPVIRTAEVRTVAADDLWLSPSRDGSVALHFSWVNDVPAVLTVLPEVEERLAPFDPLPHWGKLSTIPAATVRAGYPRFGDFAALAERHDPEHVFRNTYLDVLLA
jgi:alditol oxidase